MARKKKAVTRKVAAKRGPGRPRKTKTKTVRASAATKRHDAMLDRLEVNADELETLQNRFDIILRRQDDLEAQLAEIGGVGHLDGRIAAQDKLVDDLRTRLNDTLYRVQQLEERLKKGPGLLPMLVANATDFANLKPQALAQMLLEKLAERTTEG